MEEYWCDIRNINIISFISWPKLDQVFTLYTDDAIIYVAVELLF